MRFLLADTFTASLAKLTNAEQKAVKLTAFDLQTDPRSPGLRWHKLPGLRDDRFRSVSASMDLRLIVHDSGQSRLLCYIAKPVSNVKDPLRTRPNPRRSGR